VSEFKLIDPVTGKVIFDAEIVIPEQLDPERDHIVAGPGWSLQTPEQLERTIDRPAMADCPTCEGTGKVGYTETFGDGCPTCRGKP
jgi:hypothetical protein